MSTMSGDLPSGGTFHLDLGSDVIALRATDKAAVVHPQWMTRDQLVALGDAVRGVLREWVTR